MKATEGYYIRATRIITKHDIYELCTRLSERFDEKYGTRGYGFAPEGITEGGIYFKNIPNRQGYYKSMRIHIFTKKNDRYLKVL